MTKAPAKARRKGDGRVAFLAKVDLFRSLLEAGHPQRSIYDDHAAALGISYSQFNRYVGQYLTQKESTDEHQKRTGTGEVSPSPKLAATGQQAAPASPQQTPPQPGDKPSGKPAAKPGGFVHNATAGNDRDDLI